ncbi:BrnT family toxin [Jiella mangrovi]|uniref:BrnT family toxin n=1 Tax=Jiella mangrovi TaxID=2821407 RepID=A0ABS4BP33_9HYPH|nr:BrnT family toxin [Jiella mangrovi]MBP0617991.1 BrnT family toxin [Jiella mangrovi]
MTPIFDDIEWDEGNRDKCGKHGVPIADTEYALRATPMIFEDLTHSTQERRYRAIGRSVSGRPIFVVFTLRRRGDTSYARPISARYMHSKEVRTYERD